MKNRTHDLPACSAVLQRIAPPLTPGFIDKFVLFWGPFLLALGLFMFSACKGNNSSFGLNTGIQKKLAAKYKQNAS